MLFRQVMVSVALLMMSMSSYALVVDFESTPSGAIPTDNSAITGVFTDGAVEIQLGFSTNGDIIRDIDATYENVFHDNSDSEFGYFNGGAGGPIDTPNTLGAMGDFFARSTGFPADTSQLFIIDYVNPEGTSGLSAEIWDIDGRGTETDGPFEQWLVRAFDDASNEIARLESPPGDQGEFGPLNGEPWEFGFDLGDTNGINIKKVVISYIGTAGSVGLAFDNFDANTLNRVSEPATIVLLGLGIAALRRGQRKLI